MGDTYLVVTLMYIISKYIVPHVDFCLWYVPISQSIGRTGVVHWNATLLQGLGGPKIGKFIYHYYNTQPRTYMHNYYSCTLHMHCLYMNHCIPHKTTVIYYNSVFYCSSSLQFFTADHCTILHITVRLT